MEDRPRATYAWSVGPKGLNTAHTSAEAVAQLTAGDHLCLIYETAEEQLASVVPFMRLGLERGERCMYIFDENTAEVVLAALRAGGVATDQALASGALSVVGKRETYLKEGRFDPDLMIDLLARSTAEARAAGFSALRVTGEMTWALAGEAESERLIEYESRLNRFFPGSSCLAICQYNRKRFSARVIRDVIRTHPLVIVGQIVCRNPWFVPPDELLSPPLAGGRGRPPAHATGGNRKNRSRALSQRTKVRHAFRKVALSAHVVHVVCRCFCGGQRSL